MLMLIGGSSKVRKVTGQPTGALATYLLLTNLRNNTLSVKAKRSEASERLSLEMDEGRERPIPKRSRQI